MTTQIEVKERPILFSGPMVKAILEGRKTQTRRVVKAKQYAKFEENTIKYALADYHAGPYGKPGDQLWVRETFSWDKDGPHTGPLEFRATYPSNPAELAWKPSIFMPRWASRITLEITSVRVERLQDISGYDACHEGAPYETIMDDHYDGRDYRKGFQQLWESINGKKYPWSTNPFVWVVEFKRVTP